MAVFELSNDENVIFAGGARMARGRLKNGQPLHHHTNISAIRTRHKDGSTQQYTVGADRRFTVPDTDTRAIRHLEADPRFTRIS